MKNDLKLYFEKALRWQHMGLFEKAKSVYQKILKVAPDQPDTLHLLGCLEYDRGNVDQAISLLNRAILLAPDKADCYSHLGHALQGSGRTQRAMACYQKAIALNPDLMEAYYNLGGLFRQNNRLKEAQGIMNTALQRFPNWGEGWYLLGDIHLQDGKADKAIICFEKALEQNSNLEKAWFYLGNAYRQSKNFQNAEKCYKHGLEIKPDFTECLNNLGLVYYRTNRFSAAVACYKKAIQFKADFVEAHYNLGNVLNALGRKDDAISCYQHAIHFKTDYIDPMMGLGALYHANGDYHQAFRWYHNAHSVFPAKWQIVEQLGNVKRLSGDLQSALGFYRQALKINPNAYTVFTSFGNTYRLLSKLEDALSSYQSAIDNKPDYLPALNNMAITLIDIGKSEEAKSLFDRMLEIADDFSTHVKKAMTLPIIYPSVEAILTDRKTFVTSIEGLMSGGSRIEDPYHEIGISNFILALHGVDEKPVRELLARFYTCICPNLVWSSPTLPRRTQGNKIKLGIVCRYLHNHTIGRLYGGLIEKIDKARFELFIFRFYRKEDSVSQTIDRCAKDVVYLPLDIYAARERIAAAELDLLFFPEIGMDPLTYFIAFSRLAPVQCKRGFQITMGIPTIDYFISSDAAEPPDAQQYYSEKLIRLKGTGYYYQRPEMPDEFPDRAAYGLPGDRKLYVCTQSLFKLHPDFDIVLDKILGNDPHGTLVLLEGLHPHWKTLLLNRFQRTAPRIIDRIHFLPRQPRKEFMNLHLLADAVMDSIYFSGGHTSLECFAWGIPVVTWPSKLLPGRLTYGFYKQMGVMECVAGNLKDYVEIAFRLANDVAWRKQISRKIMERSAALYENIDDVKELEQFFHRAVNKAYSKNQ